MRFRTAPEQDPSPRPGGDPPGAIFVRFLKFGALAWGGPAAQIVMIKRECVDEEHWVDEQTFKKTLAVYQVLPGPEAHELCVYFGRIRGGKVGGLFAGVGFMLPGFVLMLALSVLYVEVQLADHLDELFYGLTAAVGAVVARAARAAQPVVHHRRAACGPRCGRLRADGVRVRELRARPARRRACVRAMDERVALDAASTVLRARSRPDDRGGRGRSRCP